MRVLRPVVVLLVTGLLLALATAGPASAHNRFVSSDPADGATVARTPAAVVLTFDEPALALGTQVVVTGPDGPVGRGAAQLVDETVRQPLAGGAPAGTYTVDWRATSADGHPISGRLSFVSEAAGAEQPDAADAPAVPEPTSGTGIWVVLALVVLLGVTVAVVALRRRRGVPVE